MTEKEKRDKGELYNLANSDELMLEIRNCKKMCYEYNHISPDKMEERKECIKKILGSTGENLQVESNFYCDYGYNTHVGENFYVNHNCVILDVAKVEFGDNVFIGPNCGFYTAGHPLDAETRNQGLEFGKPIKVGNNVWIGGNVVVLPGVTIGDNVTIGAGSVVTKNIPSNTVAHGNPCRVVKNI